MLSYTDAIGFWYEGGLLFAYYLRAGSATGVASGRNLLNKTGTCRALNSTISISIRFKKSG